MEGYSNLEKYSYVYILFNKRNGTLYVGVTGNLQKRMAEHKSKTFKGFTEKYEVDKLGYFEEYTNIKIAICREKEIKGKARKYKLDLIEPVNPDWVDLAATWFL